MSEGSFWLKERLTEWAEAPALIWQGRSFSYAWLIQAIQEWSSRLKALGVLPGQVIALEGNYSPAVCALFLALAENRNVAVPLSLASHVRREEFSAVAQVQAVFQFDPWDEWKVKRFPREAQDPLFRRLQDSGAPGLVLFSSGSTGKSKGAVHNLELLLEKFKPRRRRLRTLTFLLLDHIGGINTLLYTLSNGGTVVSVRDLTPPGVCRAIEEHRVELLPTSPTFLNLLLISQAYREFDLTSLKMITYGTEPMPAWTLKRLNELFPHVEFLQTYGLSELGILRSKSKDSSSLWVKIGGEGFETKVVENVLWIRSRFPMLGYLNAPHPFDEEGWFNTQDVVEVDGEYLRILGRQSEIINVGGEKVYPAEVEEMLLQMENVRDVTVRGQKNPILGHVVAARFNLYEAEELDSLKRRVRAYCKDRLARYKIPARIEIAQELQWNERFKKARIGCNAGD